MDIVLSTYKIIVSKYEHDRLLEVRKISSIFTFLQSFNELGFCRFGKPCVSKISFEYSKKTIQSFLRNA